MEGVTLRRSVYWFRRRINGILVQQSLKTSDEIEAITKANQIIADGNRKDRVEAIKWPRAVEAFISHKRSIGNQTKHLHHQHQMIVKTGQEMGVSDPGEVTAAHVEKWMQLRKNPRTQLMYLEMLARFFRWLVETRRIAKNPCDGIVRAKRVPKAIRKRFLSREEADRLLATDCGEDLKFMLYCMLHAGLRKGEVIAARPGWFDLGAGLLHVTAEAGWHAKDGDNRTIPLTPQFQAFLKTYGLRSPYMLRPEKKQGKYEYRVEMKLPFARHLEACGITNCTFHDLRRTFGSLYLSAGGSVWKLCKWLGDGIEVVQAHYGHLVPADPDISRAWEKPKKRK